MKDITQAITRVETFLRELNTVRIAVSGGVDSMTLALIAGRTEGCKALMYHAVSPAVPPAAGERVQAVARREQWQLHLLDAGEFVDERYLQNPHDRCFHCKSHLYQSIAARVSGTVLSGTNLDDMNDYRPGLQAAAQFGVQHPFVACGIGKAEIRRICHHLDYPDLAALPASPCLSSRIETGVRIDAAMLTFVNQVEERLRRALQPATVRCRVGGTSIRVELDEATLQRLSVAEQNGWRSEIRQSAAARGLPATVNFEVYRMGSAFLRDEN